MNEQDGDRISELYDRLDAAIAAMVLRSGPSRRFVVRDAWARWYRRSRYYADSSM